MVLDPDTVLPDVRLPSGELIPVLGMGTWFMGEDPERRAEEIAALHVGLDLGVRAIDTAEMYGDGAAERLVGEAMKDRRPDVFLVTKVLPHNATARGTIAACDGSLRRLKTEYIDLYLLHWRGTTPLEETVQAMEKLVRDRKTRYWGVSNFDVDDMEELINVTGGDACAANQVLYNLAHRGAEWDLLPWCQRAGIAVMAYSPIEQGRLLGHPTLQRVAARHDVTPAQVALKWVLRSGEVMAIPRASKTAHVRENRAALDLELTDEDLADLDRAFPPPDSKRPLEMI